MAEPRDYLAGSSSLVMGVDSYTKPDELGDQEFVAGQNTVCRGGIVQTRPGTRSLFCLPDGNFQGMTLFTPDNGVAQLVAAVDGKIYVSASPFTSYRRLWNLQFSSTAKNIAWCATLQSTDFTVEGELYSLDDPRSVLIMQDGLTRAAYWDGSTSAHINPAPAPDNTDTATQGYQGTPIGLWMIWAGNRLWVSRDNQIYASDIGNPLKFTESQYLNEGRAFYLSSPCTGFIATPEQQGIIAFTENDGTYFQSSIQDRTLWLATPEFQKIILPNVGCIAPRSLITQYGLNWWFSPRGLTNFNAALRLNISSRIDYQDNQMFASKAYLGPDLSGVCAGYYENYLMVSVPSADVLNRHTWALDQAPFEGNVNSWCGIWTGWRPIEWARGIVNGDERVFFGSIDYDGSNRIWEAMLPEKTDNGCAITCYAQLRDHSAGNLGLKRYEWSKFFLSQIYGEVDLNVYVASTKGSYQFQKSYHIVASPGQIFSDTEYSEAGPLMIGNTVQSRTIRTPADPDNNDCNACGVESKEGNMIDYAFSHLLVWSGQMGLRAYQMHMRESPERNDGDCEEPEVGPRTLTAAGCSGLELLVDGGVFDTFTAYAEGTTTTAYGGEVYIRREAVSSISQENAQALADCAVQQIIAQFYQSNISPGVYGTQAAEIGGGSYVVVSGRPPDPCVPISIYSNPDDDYATSSGSASFSILAQGNGISYQWQESTDSGSSWSDISDTGIYSGATTNALMISSVSDPMNGYLYRCIASNSCSIETSESATLYILPATVSSEVLIVGGGGGGGAGAASSGGGGGGGGGTLAITPSLSTSTSYPVVVGVGGARGAVGTGATGSAGGQSSFSASISGGGGYGGGGAFANRAGGGGVAASGGGGGGPNGSIGGSGFNSGGPAVGKNGGQGWNGSGGGGGGSSTAGSAGSPDVNAGNGGAGLISSISGSSQGYAGGGGGGFRLGTSLSTGSQGGGNGANSGNNATSGNYYGGGGGGGALTNREAGDGYQGVVIVRYLASFAYFAGGTITYSGGYAIHTFTSNGTLASL